MKTLLEGFQNADGSKGLFKDLSSLEKGFIKDPLKTIEKLKKFPKHVIKKKINFAKKLKTEANMFENYTLFHYLFEFGKKHKTIFNYMASFLKKSQIKELMEQEIGTNGLETNLLHILIQSKAFNLFESYNKIFNFDLNKKTAGISYLESLIFLSSVSLYNYKDLDQSAKEKHKIINMSAFKKFSFSKQISMIKDPKSPNDIFINAIKYILKNSSLTLNDKTFTGETYFERMIDKPNFFDFMYLHFFKQVNLNLKTLKGISIVDDIVKDKDSSNLKIIIGYTMAKMNYNLENFIKFYKNLKLSDYSKIKFSKMVIAKMKSKPRKFLPVDHEFFQKEIKDHNIDLKDLQPDFEKEEKKEDGKVSVDNDSQITIVESNKRAPKKIKIKIGNDKYITFIIEEKKRKIRF